MFQFFAKVLAVLNWRRSVAVACIALGLFSTGIAQAETATTLSPLAFQEALGADHSVSLFTPQNNTNFNISSSYFSGPASGVAVPNSVANFNTDQQLYAVLIDGRYDFNYEAPALSSPLRPYVTGGMGMATLGRVGAAELDAENGSMVPLFRLGGGVAYRLGQQWDLSLDYKMGRASLSTGDQVFTGRGQQPVDLQTLNLGMRLNF